MKVLLLIGLVFLAELCIGSIVPGSHVKIDDNKEMQTILVGKMADDKINKFMDSFRKVSAENSLEEMKQGMFEMFAVVMASKSKTIESEWLQLLIDTDQNSGVKDNNLVPFEEIISSRMNVEDTHHFMDMFKNMHLKDCHEKLINTANQLIAETLAVLTNKPLDEVKLWRDGHFIGMKNFDKMY